MTLDDLGDRLFADVPEVAQILGRDVRTVRAAIQAGQIPATKIGEHRYSVRVSWLREQAGMTQPQAAVVPDLGELADQLAPLLLDRIARMLTGLAQNANAGGHDAGAAGAA